MPGLGGTTIPETSRWLSANARGAKGVDRDNRIIYGYVVAQEGPFLEPEPRGEFDEKSLRQIVALMKKHPRGLKSNLGHPTLSNDGIGSFLGRAKNPRLDTITATIGGEVKELAAVRADLHLADSAFESNPNGNIGEYILARAEEDPDSFASSLRLIPEEEWRLDSHKRRRLNADGKELPPLWRPVSLLASDVVDTGAAVSSFLSADVLSALPDHIVREGCQLLDAQFAGCSESVIRSRLSAFVERYLSYRFPREDEPEAVHNTPQTTTPPVDDGTAFWLWIACEE